MGKRSKKKIIAAIQARMNSTRLPGKPLMMIAGKTMLEHILERVSLAKNVDEVCVSTTDNRLDDKMAEFLSKRNIAYFRGAEEDIAARLSGTADKFGADVIVRIWGDCPLIDPAVIDVAIGEFLSSEADFATNSEPPSYPFGMNVEVYKADLLKDITRKTEDPFLREFPIEYIKKSNNLKMVNTSFERDASGIKLTVDYDKDAVLVEKIMKDLASPERVPDVHQIISYCENNPKIFDETKELPRNIEYKEELEKRKS